MVVGVALALLAVGLCLVDGDADDDGSAHGCAPGAIAVCLVPLVGLTPVGQLPAAVLRFVSPNMVRVLDPPPKPLLAV